MMAEDTTTESEGTTPAPDASEDTTEQTGESTSEESQDDDAEASDAESSESGEPKAPEPPKKKSGIQRLKERHRRELDEIRQEIASLKSQESRGQRQEEPKSKPSGKPDPETFEGTHAEYLEALTDWKLKDWQTAELARSKEAQAKDAYKSLAEKHSERVQKFKEQNPDYDRIVEDFVDEHGDVAFSLGLQQAILESEEGPALIKELLSKPEEFARINAMSPFAVAREIGRMEARFAKQDLTPKTVIKTNAPKPPTPINGKSASAVRKSLYDKDISFEDYEKIRLAELKSKKG